MIDTNLTRASEHRVTVKLGDYIEVYKKQLARIDYIFVHELDQRRAFAVVCPLMDVGKGRDKILNLPLLVQTRDRRVVGLFAIGSKKPYIVDPNPLSSSQAGSGQANARTYEESLEFEGRESRGEREGSSLILCDWELHFL